LYVSEALQTSVVGGATNREGVACCTRQPGVAAMEAFTFFIGDYRYSVPKPEFVLAGDRVRAKQLATDRLIASPKPPERTGAADR
jgi:hypothetical protein